MLRATSFCLLRRAFRCAAPLVALALGCGGPRGEVANEESAQYAYLGLDGAVDRALQLGFDGFNAAKSANIPEQTGDGDAAGTMTVVEYRQRFAEDLIESGCGGTGEEFSVLFHRDSLSVIG